LNIDLLLSQTFFELLYQMFLFLSSPLSDQFS
jgi:hypothetical protein